MSIGQNRGWFWLVCALVVTGIAQAQTATETVLYTFGNFPHGTIPYGTLIRDSAGNLYGTTNQGCSANAGGVFEVEASGSFKVLYCFQGGADGSGPYAGVVMGSAGNLYGTTHQGGASGKGVVYKLNTSGQETVLYSFTGGADGSGPYAGVIPDSNGPVRHHLQWRDGECGRGVQAQSVRTGDGFVQLHGRRRWRESIRGRDVRFRGQSIWDHLLGR